MTSEFLSIENFKLCSNILNKYIEDEYGFQTGIHTDPQLKKNMFAIMQELNQTQGKMPGVTLKGLNNAVLNEMRDVCLAKFNITTSGSKRTRVKVIEREKDVYSDRPINLGEHLKPSMNPPRRDDVVINRSIDDVRQDRDAAFGGDAGGPDPKQLPFPVIKESKAPSATELNIQLEMIEKQRQNITVPLPAQATSQAQPQQQPQQVQKSQIQQPPAPTGFMDGTNRRLEASFDIMHNSQKDLPDPKMLYSMTVDDRKNDPAELVVRNTPYNNFSQDVLLGPKSQAEMHHKTSYLLFNGFDRRWDVDPLRYAFTIDINDTTSSIRNVVEICFTKLIIPMEVLQLKKTVMSHHIAPYYNQYGMTYQYLILQIDELSPGLYEGFNMNLRKSSATFVMEHEYRAANGRGFIILKPLQKEKKKYETPLSSMPRLTFHIRKPNGTLYNIARDENRVSQLLYETVNPLLIKLICRDFYDANEFAIGDVVRVRDFKMPSATAFAESVYAASSVTVPEDELRTYDLGILALEEFINRDEGHEIILAGDPNQTAFINAFCVYLPRKLDKEQGVLVLQKDIYDTISIYQQYMNAAIPNTGTGRMLNMTLQVVLGMKVKTKAGDLAMAINSITV